MFCSATFCTFETIPDEQSPRFLFSQSFGWRHPQPSGDLPPIEIFLMPKSKYSRAGRACGSSEMAFGDMRFIPEVQAESSSAIMRPVVEIGNSVSFASLIWTATAQAVAFQNAPFLTWLRSIKRF
jgi:hypothetical protein